MKYIMKFALGQHSEIRITTSAYNTSFSTSKKHSTNIVMLQNILERFNSESEIDKTQLPDLFTKIDHTIAEDLRLKDFAVRFGYFDGDANGSAKKRKRK